MRIVLLAFVFGLVFGAPRDLAQEAIVLTKPITAPTRTGYQPVRLELTVFPQAMIEIHIRGNDGFDERFVYPCKPGECATDTEAETAAMINGLNTANLTTRSLWRRAFDRVCADFAPRFPGGCTVQ